MVVVVQVVVVILTMEIVASVDHIRILEEPASLLALEEEVAVTDTVAQAPLLLELVTVVVEPVVALVGGQEEGALVRAVVTQVYSPLHRVPPHHPAAEVGVVPAPATVLAVVDMVAVHLAAEDQAIPLVALEVEEVMDRTAAVEGEAPPLDAEVDRGDIQVVPPVEAIALHSPLQVEEGGIPMVPHHHRIVSHHRLVVPATAMIPRRIKC